ncbi:Aldo/keto reductase [Lactarius akahatsu]|uniref:Aldo/keto reductase n=1 Tax=Lactarius akahatsu TaxID=416441 RepID=A0AAD4LLT5_9AGAM|nr:Aldo/keto reductase [Lactarius akahatsu]
MAPLYSLSPPPPTKLGRYRLLSPLAGVRVSPFQLGAMSIGNKWHEFGIGSMDKTNSFKLLDAYFDAGLSSGRKHQDESSEAFIGEWAEKRGIRDQLVITTKYSTNYKRGQSDITHMVNYSGNGSKSLHVSVEASLKKLRTTYIDILNQGKVLYLANQYAKDHGKMPFSVYQGSWSIFERSLERDIIPMARSEGLALAPWGVLAGGKIQTNAEEARRKGSGEKGRTTFDPEWERTMEQKRCATCLKRSRRNKWKPRISQLSGFQFDHPYTVAIAYHLHKLSYVFPIIGGRKVEHLKENIAALDISLTAKQIKRIGNATPFDLGFPYNMFGDNTTDNYVAQCTARCDRVPLQQPITPVK